MALAKRTNRTIIRTPKIKADSIGRDNEADKTGTDVDSDKTGSIAHVKFDKPKRETDPDRTEIAVHSDKTKPGVIKNKSKH
jgi:hypothetical protein